MIIHRYPLILNGYRWEIDGHQWIIYGHHGLSMKLNDYQRNPRVSMDIHCVPQAIPIDVHDRWRLYIDGYQHLPLQKEHHFI